MAPFNVIFYIIIIMLLMYKQHCNVEGGHSVKAKPIIIITFDRCIVSFKNASYFINSSYVQTLTVGNLLEWI